MCGIFVCITNDTNDLQKLSSNDYLRDFLHRRGPDSYGKKCITIETSEKNNIHITLMSSALQLRGETLSEQPLSDSLCNVLQWNGQIFGGDIEVPQCDSDTHILLKRLSQSSNDEDLLSVISLIRGPFAFTYWNDDSKCLWFGRDIFGRRSLCWNRNERNDHILISSFAFDSQFINGHSIEWSEVPADGVYCLSLTQSTVNFEDHLKHYEWNKSISGLSLNTHSNLTLASPITVPLNKDIPTDEDLNNDIPNHVINDFIDVLRNSVRKRCLNHQNQCKDCFVQFNGEMIADDALSTDSGDICVTKKVNHDNHECTHASTAILFSGGIDSTVIALLADECIDQSLPIDLLNVAFDNDAPDRETGLNAWNELRNLRPNRIWNLVTIHVSREELQTTRDKHVKHLVRPSVTVLDDSIGCAIWFASQGKGLLLNECLEASLYSTPARVVLLGMGADEQLAGYSRHRRIFDMHGWGGLIKELAMEIDRLSSRNLGRDDRVVSDHGREPRYPFLDEDVVNFLNGLPIWHKCNLTLDRSAGEKLILRIVAQRLGLCQTANHLKRAIQFGSRIAKIEESKEKGADLCSRLAP